MIFLFIVVVLLISLMEIIALSPKNNKKDLAVFIALAFFTLSLGIIYFIYQEHLSIADLIIDAISRKAGGINP